MPDFDKLNVMLTHSQIREKFLEFFKKRGHKIVPSSSLLPDDPSVLLTTAGMQQFKRYFTGELDPIKDFGSKNTASIQKAFRTSDIDEVGDESHLTFFQMLGHFSFGDYFKKETINWTYELLTKVFKISAERIEATVFWGDDTIPFDQESFDAWSMLLPPERIRKGPRTDNVWGHAGTEGPCGACNEVYVDDVEVATLVFMEYYCHTDKKLTKLAQKGVDVGWGFERIVAKIQDKKNIFETDLFIPLTAKFPTDLSERYKRIIADHLRASVFLIADGVIPSNKEQGYILRRLLRRIFLYEHLEKLSPQVFEDVIKEVIDTYGQDYSELRDKKDHIINTYFTEWQKFKKTLTGGLRELDRLQKVDADTAFRLYESYGLPFEAIKDAAGDKAKSLTRENFDKEFKKHQEKSRAGAEKKFGGHGLVLDTGELKAGNEEELRKATRLHTATHLLHAALRNILGSEVKQAGSDITAERLRFDFSFPRKVTPDELKQVENQVNEVIKKDLPVTKKEMSYQEAIKLGALAFFKLKYPPKVNVYTIGDENSPYSRELCGGPHVTHTAEIGQFKIVKEEANSAGVRRIRATID